jgi:preprotein translocase subunit SecF
VATAVGGRERHCVSVRAWQSQTLSRTVNTEASTLLVLAALLLLGATR